jgi:hypothetical protein
VGDVLAAPSNDRVRGPTGTHALPACWARTIRPEVLSTGIVDGRSALAMLLSSRGVKAL